MKKISISLFLLSIFQVCNAGWWYSDATTIEAVEFINDDESLRKANQNKEMREKYIKHLQEDIDVYVQLMEDQEERYMKELNAWHTLHHTIRERIKEFCKEVEDKPCEENLTLSKEADERLSKKVASLKTSQDTLRKSVANKRKTLSLSQKELAELEDKIEAYVAEKDRQEKELEEASLVKE